MKDRIVPLSVRTSTDPAAVGRWNVLHEGVPRHLEFSLQKWVGGIHYWRPATAASCQRILRLPMVESGADVALEGAMAANSQSALEVVDVLVQLLHAIHHSDDEVEYDRDAAAEWVTELAQMLEEGNSAWRVATEPKWHLACVVDKTATFAFEATRDSSTDAGPLIAEAWRWTFKNNHDYTAAYGKVVQAVESAALPVLAPNDKTATLGKAINNLRTAQNKWTVSALDDKTQSSAATLLSMLETIWQNHQRHSSNDGRAPEPAEQQETEAVLFLAITVIQWFERGFVQEKHST